MKLMTMKVLATPAVMALVGVLTFAATTELQSDASEIVASSSGPPSIEELDSLRNELDTQKAEDDAKPRYFGSLGDFEIVMNDADAAPSHLCPTGYQTHLPGEFVQSELSKPNMTEQLVCDDGTVVATYSQETGRKSHFAGSPAIAALAPRDRLTLQEVDGYAALVVEPPTDYGPYFVYVIQRQATDDENGILLAVMGGIDRERAIELARRALMGE